MPSDQAPTISSSARPLVVFDGVKKSYDGVTNIVDNLHLSIGEGEFLTLLGPSGSGKTTTLMMLAGFERPTDGVINFDGKRINDTPTYKRNFGMVFQNYALFPHMTVAQNLAFPLRMRKTDRSDIDKRVLRALDMVKLSHVADRRPAQLSGGQQQRVALARAMIFEPRMVLMDEPLGALDKQLREHMQLEIRALHESLGITMLYVTHDQSEALTMSDRIAIFNEGNIQHIGTPDDVYDNPLNAFVATFMGESCALTGTITRIADSRVSVKTAAGAIIETRTTMSFTEGNDAQVLIRPERIHLSASAMEDMNTFPACVTDVIYHGDHLRVTLDLEHIGPVTAKLSHADLPRPPIVGDTLFANWRPQASLAFRI